MSLKKLHAMCIILMFVCFNKYYYYIEYIYVTAICCFMDKVLITMDKIDKRVRSNVYI